MSVHRYNLLTFALYCFNADYLFSHIKRRTTEQTNKQTNGHRLGHSHFKGWNKIGQAEFQHGYDQIDWSFSSLCSWPINCLCWTFGGLDSQIRRYRLVFVKVYRWKNIMSILESFVLLIWKNLNFQFLPKNWRTHAR